MSTPTPVPPPVAPPIEASYPPQVPGPSVVEAQKASGVINVQELEARFSALEATMHQWLDSYETKLGPKIESMEAALAGTVGHLIAGARTASTEVLPEAKSALSHVMDWFEVIREKYFPGSAPSTLEQRKAASDAKNAAIRARQGLPPA